MVRRECPPGIAGQQLDLTSDSINLGDEISQVFGPVRQKILRIEIDAADIFDLGEDQEFMLSLGICYDVRIPYP